MRYLKYLVLLAIFLVPAAYSHAQVAVGVGVGPAYGGPAYYGGYDYPAPVCDYGYYGTYPYACAPYGYYGPAWFSGGFFIGAGPWYGGWGRGFGFGRGGFGRGGFGRGGWRCCRALAAGFLAMGNLLSERLRSFLRI